MQDDGAAPDADDLLTITASIVSAHLRHNKVSAEALPALITGVHQALAGLGVEPAAEPAPGPAVAARRSIFPEYLICLEDGAKVKMLRPYLQRRFGLSPAAYRAKWGLPPDYPMVAPAYAARRSALARQFGLGSQRGGSAGSSELPDVTPPPDDTLPAAQGLSDAEWEQAAPAPDTGAAPEAEPADVPTDDADVEVEYTAEAVFANFPQAAGGGTDGLGLPRQKRKRFSDQTTRQMPVRRRPKSG